MRKARESAGRPCADDDGEKPLCFMVVNVQLGLAFHLNSILKRARDEHIQFVLIQEIAVEMNNRHNIRKHARSHGFETFYGHDTKAGTHVITFASCHAELFVPPPEVDDERVLWLQIHREQQRPAFVANIYAHASNPIARDRLIEKQCTFLRSTGEDGCIAGDWNCIDEEGGVGRMLANGVVFSADDCFGATRQPTRDSGRRIDYALTTMHWNFTERSQGPGPGDHDWVAYRAASDCKSGGSWHPPRFRQLCRETPIVEDEVWDCIDTTAFESCCVAKDTEQAWKILSVGAENLLQANPTAPRDGDGHCRHDTWTPEHKQRSSRRPPCPENLKLRRLRRIEREWRTLQAEPWSFQLRHRIDTNLRQFAKAYPALAGLSTWDPAGLQEVRVEIDNEVRCEATRKIQIWQGEMACDVNAQRRWIRAASDEEKLAKRKPTVCFDRAVHPVDKVANEGDWWQHLWNRDHAVDTGCFTFGEDERDLDDVQCYLDQFIDKCSDLCEWIPQGGFECPDTLVTTDALISAAKRMRHRAAGPDAWTTDQLLRLPVCWWELLRRLWSVVLSSGRLPQAWHHARATLLPKPCGGSRPLTITSVGWRVGASAIARALAPWSDAWAPPSLVGGLAHRSGEDIHARIHHD